MTNSQNFLLAIAAMSSFLAAVGVWGFLIYVAYKDRQ